MKPGAGVLYMPALHRGLLSRDFNQMVFQAVCKLNIWRAILFWFASFEIWEITVWCGHKPLRY